MLFRVLAGRHVDGNKTYVKDDIIESDVDLMERFGGGKFERDLAAEIAAEEADSKKKASSKAATPPSNPLGDDVTADFFEDADTSEIKVYKTGSRFNVVTDDEPDVPQNEKPVTKKQAEKLIDTLLDEEIDEDTD